MKGKETLALWCWSFLLHVYFILLLQSLYFQTFARHFITRPIFEGWRGVFTVGEKKLVISPLSFLKKPFLFPLNDICR